MLKPKSWASTSSGQRTRFLPPRCACARQVPLSAAAMPESWHAKTSLASQYGSLWVPSRHLWRELIVLCCWHA